MKKFAIISLVAVLTLSSCDSYTTSGAFLGGAVGSAIGGMAGGWRGSDIGTLVGMATGAAVGAATRESVERSRARAYYDDDVYSTGDPKAERIRRYHENTAAKHSGGNGYRGQRELRVGSNGVTMRNGSSQHGTTYTPRQQNASSQQRSQQNDNSGYSKEGKYDDSFEIK